ncbi:unnamed protein product [Acanthoscelides obtectus]|nr:unnamed protein product [Acanthoscelides obtectus]CAK1657911.1 Putative deoxyribonuclease TATDN1 [Acanthoscelides obtectus]
MYLGIYNGSKKHESDLQQILQRSWAAGLCKMIITGGNLEESRKSVELTNMDDRLYATVGCHPTRCGEFEENGTNPEDYLQKLKDTILSKQDKVVAIGECGLDYDRTQFCSKDVQKKYFEYQLKLTEYFKLPLFLHCRNAADDLYNILSKHSGLEGVVHSFDGTSEEANKFIDLGYYIGLNGCSLKTEENLEVVKALPAEKILFETDCPWCEIRPTHAGYKYIQRENLDFPSVKKEKWKPDHMVKSRNEPCNIRHVLDIVSAIRNEDPDELCEKVFQNTLSLFFSDE